MNIIYKDNPLASIVELDEAEQRELWLKIKLTKMEHIIEFAWLESKKTHYDIEKIRKDLDIDYWCPEDNTKSKLDKSVDELFDICIAELKEIHIGDCTCVPCSCTKCYAEDLLGINTIPYLKQHPASMIESAFSEFESIDDVIHFLDNYVPDRSKGGWDSESDERWNEVSPEFIEDAADAAIWLKKYKIDKLL
jgi:hypothetical protein